LPSFPTAPMTNWANLAKHHLSTLEEAPLIPYNILQRIMLKNFTNIVSPPCYSKQERYFDNHTKEGLLTLSQLKQLAKNLLNCLASTNPEYFSPACRANPLCSWSLVLQGDPLRILYLYFPSTLKTISLHSKSPPSWYRLNYTPITGELSSPFLKEIVCQPHPLYAPALCTSLAPLPVKNLPWSPLPLFPIKP